MDEERKVRILAEARANVERTADLSSATVEESHNELFDLGNSPLPGSLDEWRAFHEKREREVAAARSRLRRAELREQREQREQAQSWIEFIDERIEAKLAGHIGDDELLRLLKAQGDALDSLQGQVDQLAARLAKRDDKTVIDLPRLPRRRA
jgi:hypothetical protein